MALWMRLYNRWQRHLLGNAQLVIRLAFSETTRREMIETFAKAPLVEIVAELRWQPSGQPLQLTQAGGGAGISPAVFIGDTTLEEFFLGFASHVNQLGFPRAERLVPSGVPLMPFRPVWRFRRSDNESAGVLYHIGPGLFSANAIPPYRSWRDFSPVVKSGVEALLKTRVESEKDAPFSQQCCATSMPSTSS